MTPTPGCYYDPEVLDPRNRSDGISAILRVRDGAQFLRLNLESCIDIFDEIVAVHHQCSDNTPHILREYATAYPERFKVYEYPHEVFPPLTKEHEREGPKSPHTIAALCNYALSKTTKRFVIKNDADHLYFPRFAEIANFVRSRRANNRPIHVFGVNLARSPTGNLGVCAQYPMCGGEGDFLFFPVSRGAYYVHSPEYEYLHLPRLRSPVFVGFGFWHLKFLQHHYGIHQYLQHYKIIDDSKKGYYRSIEDPLPNDRNRRYGMVANFKRTLKVVSLEEFVTLYGGKNSPFIIANRAIQLSRWRRKYWVFAFAFYWTLSLINKFIPLFGSIYTKVPINSLLFQRFYWHILPSLEVRSVARNLRGISLPTEVVSRPS